MVSSFLLVRDSNPVAFRELCDFSKPASLFIYDGWRNAVVAVDLAGFFKRLPTAVISRGVSPHTSPPKTALRRWFARKRV